MTPTPKRDVPAPRRSSPSAASGALTAASPASGGGDEPLMSFSRLAEELASFELWDEHQPPAVVAAAAEALVASLGYALELLRALERDWGAADPELDFEREPETRRHLILERPARPTLGDLCFAGTLELSRARRALLRAHGPEPLLTAGETALRKARRLCFAVLQAAQAEATTPHVDAERLRRSQALDLSSALTVRRLYAEFRRGLRRPERHDPESVLTALRYAAGALASLSAASDYARARTSDRYLLRRLRERLLAWAHGERDVEQGLQLLDDAWTCADLLRSINRRQELRAHDAAKIEALLRAEATGREHGPADLDALRGLDDELDALIASNATLAQLRARLERLR